MNSFILDCETINLKLGWGINGLYAVCSSMTSQHYNPEDFIDALFAIYDYLYSLNQCLNSLIDGEIKNKES